MKIRRSKRQSAWEFMRRNQTFRAEDVLIITQMSKQNMRVLISQLVKLGLLQSSSKRNIPLEDKVFILMNASSVICPVKSPSKYIKKEKR